MNNGTFNRGAFDTSSEAVFYANKTSVMERLFAILETRGIQTNWYGKSLL